MKSLAREFGRSGTTANTRVARSGRDRARPGLARRQSREAHPALSAAPAGAVGRRGADGGVAGLAPQRLDHRAGASASAAASAWFDALRARKRDTTINAWGDAMLHTEPDCSDTRAAATACRARGSKVAYRDAHGSVTYAAAARADRQSCRPSGRYRDRARRDGRDPAAEFGAMGRDLPGDRARRRRERPDQRRCDRAGDRLPAVRCELPGHRHAPASAAIWWRDCGRRRRTFRP